ncbi:hypothetical protein [Hoeflea sp.]|uniref:hypothetical protein n=1 Tax=Hoeflea sp. TaxID=1940281 RepID=UPI003B023437
MKPKKNKGGRPYALKPDAQTLKIIRGLGKIQATTKECAIVLGVSNPTFITFKKDNPKAGEAYKQGIAVGQTSRRRRQFKLKELNAAAEVFPIADLLEQEMKNKTNSVSQNNGD